MSRHGNGIRCTGCGGTFPVTRETLRAKHRGGYKCKSCRRRGRPKGRPTNYGKAAR